MTLTADMHKFHNYSIIFAFTFILPCHLPQTGKKSSTGNTYNT